MPKIAKGTDLPPREIPPTAVYYGVLTQIKQKPKQTPWGTRDTFYFIFDLKKYKKRVGGKMEWKDIPADKSYQVIKSTNTSYGQSNASLTAFLPQLISDLADTFMDTVGDTDALIGWRGELSVKQGTSDAGKPFAEIVSASPDEDWLSPWSANMTGDRELLAKASKGKSAEGKASEGNGGIDPEDIADPFDED